jgi:hypothetical protein
MHALQADNFLGPRQISTPGKCRAIGPEPVTWCPYPPGTAVHVVFVWKQRARRAARRDIDVSLRVPSGGPAVADQKICDTP